MKIFKRKKEIRLYLRGFILLFCTAVGGYGIFTAPESDQSILEHELQQNQQTLQQINLTTEAQAKIVDEETDAPIKKGLKAKLSKQEDTISVIGDSVFLGAAPSFKKIQKNAIIDAKISRQVYHALDVAKELKKKGKLGHTVLIALGINGPFSQSTGQALLDYLGKDRTIYWINAYGRGVTWQKDVNQTIQKLVKKNPNLYLISWAKEAKKHPDWFYQDGTHLNTKGQEGFSRFIKKNIN